MSMSLMARLQSLEGRPRWHGNGFLQLDLNARQRLHVWHPDWLPNQGHNSTIHDHVFDLTSEVLLGKVGHEAFDVVLTDTSGHWKVYRLEGWAGGPYTGAAPATHHTYVGQAVRRSTGSFLMAAGSQYSFPRHRFHESQAEGISASLMTKSNGVDPVDRPRVLCPWGEEPTDARKPGEGPPPQTQWDIIGEALDKMWKSSQARIEACIS